MNTIKLDLLWISPKKGDDPFNPIAHIIPKRYSTSDYKNINVSEGWPLLTPQCMTANELDEQVNMLIENAGAIIHH